MPRPEMSLRSNGVPWGNAVLVIVQERVSVIVNIITALCQIPEIFELPPVRKPIRIAIDDIVIPIQRHIVISNIHDRKAFHSLVCCGREVKQSDLIGIRASGVDEGTVIPLVKAPEGPHLPTDICYDVSYS